MSSWNKPSGAAKPETKKPSALRGIIAGGVIVLAACAAFFFLFTGGDKPAPTPSTKHQAPGTIKEVTPAAAPKYVEKDEPKESNAKKKETPFWERPVPKDLTPEERALWMEKAKFEKHVATDPHIQRYLKNFKPKKTTFNNGAEQVMDWIFNAKVGDVPPPPVPPIAEFENNHIMDLLDEACVVGKDDDAQTVERKKVVDEAKQELKKFVADGGDPSEFLQYYHNELVRAYEQKKMTSDAIEEVVNAGDSEVAIQFIEKANKTLEDKGIPAVELTEDQKEQLTEGFNEK